MSCIRSKWEPLPYLAAFGVFVIAPSHALAGMTVYTLTDIARARLDVISFFLLVTLVLALVFKGCWNAMAGEFPKMPVLSYKHSLAIIAVASLFCGLILTMISGARELMTPGAWEKVGTTYRLRSPQLDAELWLDSARRRAIEQIRDAIWNHAQTHEGMLPEDRFAPDIPRSLWRAPDPEKTLYGYLPRRDWTKGTFGFLDEDKVIRNSVARMKGDARGLVLLYEPLSFGNERYVILSTGKVLKLKAKNLEDQVKQEIHSAPIGAGETSTRSAP